MKKQLLRSILIATGLTLSTLSYANVGMINTAVLFKEHPKFKEVEKQLKENIRNLESSLLEDKKNIEQEQAELDEKIKKKLLSKINIKKEQKIIDDKIFLLEEKRKIFNENKQKLENEKRIEILKDIQEKSKEYASKNNYKAILDSGSVVYIEGSDDLTQKVLEEIKKAYKP